MLVIKMNAQTYMHAMLSAANIRNSMVYIYVKTHVMYDLESEKLIMYYEDWNNVNY